MSLELRQLQALVAVVDEGTFTDAAIALGISQASASRSVAALEQAVGARVLQRTTRQLSLTRTGARVVEHARRALAEVAAIQRVVDHDELRVGFAWSALGAHTTAVQERWSTEHPDTPLVFVQSGTVTSGLSEGVADVAVLRRPLDDRRFHTALVGVEDRFAAVATGDRLARRRSLSLADFADRTLAVDHRTGTTTEELWPPHLTPTTTRDVHGTDEWLTLIAAGQAVGITTAATVQQYRRPGVTYRRVRDAPPVPVWLAWWQNNPPPLAADLLRLVCEVYGAAPTPKRRRPAET
ncbi:MAG: LysR family transcriptional regulator [Propionibacteriaceae bacterium]